MEFMPGRLTPEASDELMERVQRHFEIHGFGLFAAELRMDHSFLGFIGLSIPNFDAPFMPAIEVAGGSQLGIGVKGWQPKALTKYFDLALSPSDLTAPSRSLFLETFARSGSWKNLA
jgi:hypothetical protein